MKLLYLPDTVYENIFQFCGVYITTKKLGVCCKSLNNVVKTYSRLSLSLYFTEEELERICEYQIEAVYGLPKVSMQWMLQLISVPRVFIIGGSEDSRRCDVLDMSCGTWRQCGSLSVKRERAFSVIQHNGCIYAISGSVDHAMYSVEKLNVFTNCWTSIAPLPCPIQCSAVVTYKNRLLVIGGDCRKTYKKIGTVFSMKGDESAWITDFLPSLLIGRSEHAACMYRGKIWVAGGFLCNQGYPIVGSTSVECYNAEINAWEECPSLTTDRKQFSLLVIRGVMYAVGGDCVGDKNTIERYDENSKMWIHVCDYPHKRKASCSSSIGSYIIIFGGKREGGKGRLSGYHDTYDAFCTIQKDWLSNNITKGHGRDTQGLLFPARQGQVLSFENMITASSVQAGLPITKRQIEYVNLDLYRRSLGLTNALAVTYVYPSNFGW